MNLPPPSNPDRPTSVPAGRPTHPLLHFDHTSLLHHMRDAVITTDLAFRIIGWNAAAEALYGWPAAAVVGRSVIEVLQSRLDGQDPAQVRAHIQSQGTWRGEVTHQHRDGRMVAIIATASLVRDADDSPIGIVSVNRDVSDQKAAEAQLRAYAAHLEVLSRASRVFIGAGHGYQGLLGQIAQCIAEALGDRCSIRMLSDDGAALATVAAYDLAPLGSASPVAVAATIPLPARGDALTEALLQSDRAQAFAPIDPSVLRTLAPPEAWAGLADISAYGHAVAPLRIAQQTLGLVIVTRARADRPAFTADDLRLLQDLADRSALAISRARAEQALVDEREQLAQRVMERTADLTRANVELARAAQLKDEFLASMSHELRTPLNTILGRTEALQETIYGPVTPDQIAVLQGIEESGRHLLSLINDILDLSKIEAGRLVLEYDLIDVDQLCHSSLRLVGQSALAKRLTVTSRYDATVNVIWADTRRLKQILVNLLSNAIKFTPEGGTVGLEVEGDAARRTVSFTVWDTGIGIAADDMPSLFQPFVQLDSSLSRQHEGTGLGLALVLRLAQAHGGSVEVESTPQRGSRFRVTLPWEREGQEYSLPAPRGSAAAPLPHIEQVLVIEDSPAAAEQLTRYLHELGAQVTSHPSGQDAVAQAVAQQPALIILDILLPDIDGWDVLRRLKADPRTQAIPVLVTSVVDDPERARRLGAAGVLLKPINRANFREALAESLSAASEPRPQLTPEDARPSILLVEDNEATVATLTDFLNVKGYAVAAARTGHEALARVREVQPDVILMDIQMPGMDGLEAIRRLRADAALDPIPIIALTALAMPGDRERCLGAGADAYLTKPVPLRELVALIDATRQQPR